MTLALFGQLVSDHQVCLSIAYSLQTTPPALSGPDVVVNMKKSDLEPASIAQYLGMLVDTIHERVFLTG